MKILDTPQGKAKQVLFTVCQIFKLVETENILQTAKYIWLKNWNLFSKE